MERTLVKGIQLLELLAVSEKPMGIKDLSEKTGFAQSNVHRLLKTLEYLKYVSQTGIRGTYSATPRLFAVGRSVVDQIEITTLCLPFLQQLHETSEESTSLSIWHETGPLMIKSVESKNRHPMHSYRGVDTQMPATCTSAGLALLAFQPASIVTGFAENLIQATPKSISTAAELHERLQNIRQTGHSIVEDEWQFGLTAVSVPVFRHRDVIATITISGASEHFPVKKALKFIAPMQTATNNLSDILHGHFVI